MRAADCELRLQLLDHGQRRRQRDAHLQHVLGGSQQGRARRFVALVAEVDEEAELLRFAEQLVVVDPEALGQLGPGQDLGRLGGEGRGHRLAQADEAIGVRPVLADQARDRAELEALGLHLLDQPQAGDVLGAVVAGAGADLGRRQQAARLVVADVAHRHAGLVGELLDRQRRLLGGLAAARGLREISAICDDST